MLVHKHKKRVRYGETDQMGYIYYGNYAFYYEIGRVELLRSLGLTYREMESEQGIMMPVMAMETRFLRPAFYDELLEIRTSLRTFPGREILFHCEIYNEADKLINDGTVKLCFVDMETKKRVNTPDFLLEKLKPYFEMD